MAQPRPCSAAAQPRWARLSAPGRWSLRRRSESPARRSSSRATTPSGEKRSEQPIIENQGVAFPLADIAADIDAARLLTWRAAWMAAQRHPFENAEGSMSKLKASEVAVRACEQAIQTMGGWGYIKDFPVEKWYRDAKLYTIFEGTSEIQRLVISRALRARASTEPLDQRMQSPR